MIFFLICSFAICIVTGLLAQSVSVAVAILLCTSVLAATAQNDLRKLYLHLIIIFVLQICFVWIVHEGYIGQYGSPYYRGGNDDIQFEEVSGVLFQQGKYFGFQISNEDIWRASNEYAIFANSRGFLIYLILLRGAFSVFGGYSTLIPRLFNMCFLLGAAVLIYRKAGHSNTEKSDKSRLILLYGIALFPNAMYISAHIFRDTIIMFLIVIIYYILSTPSRFKTLRKGTLLYILIVLMLSWVSYTIRRESIVYILVLALALFINKYWHLLKSRRTISLMLMLMLILTSILYVTGTLDYVFKKIQRYEELRLSSSEGLSNVIFSTELLPIGFILRLAYALISPIPVAFLNIFRGIHSFEDALALFISVGTLVQITLTPYLFSWKGQKALRIVFWVYLLSIATVTFTFRHFIMLYPMQGLIIYSSFMNTKPRQRWYNLIGMSLLLMILGSIYYLLKL